MEPLCTLVLAGLRRDKGTFIGLFLLLFLAGCVLTFTIGLFVDLSTRAHDLYDEVGGGDVWMICFDDEADARLAQLAETPEVGDVRETRAFSAPMRFERPDGEPKSDMQLFMSLFEAWETGLAFNVFTDDLSAHAANPSAPQPGEVYVTPAEKVLRNVELGDKIMLDMGGEKRWLTVTGFFEDPQAGTPFMGLKRYLVAPETFDGLYELAEKTYETAQATAGTTENDVMGGIAQGAFPELEINASLSPAARAAGLNGQDLASIIHRTSDAGTSGTNTYSKETLLGFEGIVTQVITAVLATFALLLFTIALVLCVHSVATAIAEGTVDWGIAKAVGIAPRTLRRTLIAQYALVACAALVLGFIAGIALEPLAWPAFLLVTGLLVDAPAPPWPALLCLGALLALLVGTVAAKARRLGRIKPLAALRRGTADVSFTPRGSCAISGTHLAPSLAWRAVLSQKRQYVGAFLCSFLLCAFITLCFGIGGAVADDDATHQALGLWKSDISAALVSDSVTLDEVSAVIEEVAPLKRAWSEASVSLSLDGEQHSFVGLSDFDVLGANSLITGQMPRLANEAAIGPNFARQQHLEVGDEFIVTSPAGEEKALLVSGVVSSALDGGTGIFLTLDGLEEIAGNDMIDVAKTRQYQLVDDAQTDVALAHAEERFGDEVSFDPTGLFGIDEVILLIRDVLVTVGYSMTAFAALLACVAVALVSRRMLLAERRDLGIYRALGFRVRTLRQSFALRFLGVALVGSAMGTALVMAGGSQLVGSLFGLFGAGAFTIVLPVWQAALLTAGLAAVFALSAYGFSRSIRTISVRELVVE